MRGEIIVKDAGEWREREKGRVWEGQGREESDKVNKWLFFGTIYSLQIF